MLEEYVAGGGGTAGGRQAGALEARAYEETRGQRRRAITQIEWHGRRVQLEGGGPATQREPRQIERRRQARDASRNAQSIDLHDRRGGAHRDEVGRSASQPEPEVLDRDANDPTGRGRDFLHGEAARTDLLARDREGHASGVDFEDVGGEGHRAARERSSGRGRSQLGV